MAKPKIENLVKICPNHKIHVYTDQPEKEIAGISSIEGVSSATIVKTLPIFVNVDPRYDTEEIAAEIKQLLTVEIPNVFREE